MSEVNEGKEQKKSVSKIGALLSNTQQINTSQVNVYYSQNNWKTCEIVEIMVEENTTILQLIDSAVLKLKNEFYYDDIDEKNYNLMIFKKKTKMPNYEYPKCNLESKVMGYGKSTFCLVEKENEENNINEGNKKNENIVCNNQEIEKIKKEEENNVQNDKKNDKEIKEKKSKNKIMHEKGCNKGCILF